VKSLCARQCQAIKPVLDPLELELKKNTNFSVQESKCICSKFEDSNLFIKKTLGHPSQNYNV
jgi:hypothetical protein